jgi:hypothetical protein
MLHRNNKSTYLQYKTGLKNRMKANESKSIHVTFTTRRETCPPLGPYKVYMDRGLEPISYRGALLSTLLHATLYMFLHNLLNVLVQIANKMGLQRKMDTRAVETNDHIDNTGSSLRCDLRVVAILLYLFLMFLYFSFLLLLFMLGCDLCVLFLLSSVLLTSFVRVFY